MSVRRKPFPEIRSLNLFIYVFFNGYQNCGVFSKLMRFVSSEIC